MPGGELVEPMAYHGWWPLVGLLLVAVVGGWFWWVLRSTRPPADAPAPAAPAAAEGSAPRHRRGGGDPYAAARGVALDRIATIEGRHGAGELDERGVHLELQFVVREFAAARTGVRTASLTAGLAREDRRVRRLAGLLERYAKPSFAAHSRTSVRTSLAEARRVVTRW
ncbi:hypothetical protein [Cellulomonas shaoxiangyii]|uniref:Uncharacterized protein n=1 Tax=Cellulomonas shaoxiangyii TaxID=2566013 RepID=A0A4P7SJ34_9CELL|nr:hypothetical protein [Cellulomonas shaoxiangyii]QCB92513.1 hypothetical protein E5225_02020 [Cellulomonas shaoxiangyii]TGY83396.1 hypothetical protein E5226_12240 [Cellulomonas shaoxiangyii]